MREQQKYIPSGEEGFVLALSLVVMAVLVIIGAAAMHTTIYELSIAGSDARQRETFYRSDAGLDLASELLEQEIACKGENMGGFPVSTGSSGALVGDSGLYVMDTWKPLWMRELTDTQTPIDGMPFIADTVDDSKADIVFPYGRNPDGSVTIMTINGEIVPLLGGALQMSSGYLGKGQGAASGGSARSYYIFSRHYGATGTNTNSTVLAQWSHVTGTTGACTYGSGYTSYYSSTATSAF